MDDPRKWRRGILAPVERNLTTGELRWAVPQALMDLASAFALPGDVASGTVDPMSPEGMQRAQTFATSLMGGSVGRSGEVARGAAAANANSDRASSTCPTASKSYDVGHHLKRLRQKRSTPIVPPVARFRAYETAEGRCQNKRDCRLSHRKRPDHHLISIGRGWDCCGRARGERTRGRGGAGGYFIGWCG